MVVDRIKRLCVTMATHHSTADSASSILDGRDWTYESFPNTSSENDRASIDDIDEYIHGMPEKTASQSQSLFFT